MSDRLQAAIFASLCVLLWGLIPVVAKTGQIGLTSEQFLFFSSLTSFLVMSGVALLSGKWHQVKVLRINDGLKIVANGLLGTWLYYWLLYQGYSLADGVEVLVTQYTWPVTICVLSVLILKEQWHRYKSLAVIFGFSSVVLVLTKGNLNSVTVSEPVAIFWVFVGATSFAMFSVLSKYFHYEPITLTTLYFAVATVASGVQLSVTGQWAWPASEGLLPIIVNGALVNGISYLLWIWAIKKADMSFATTFTFATPLISLLYLVLFFNEAFLAVYGIAFLLATLAGFFANKGPPTLPKSS
ncbi:DMT family transporter [Planctobacterium marinum]|uniref:DMT family transporter n=1 Tax=Planctobacterium marinum TaxID=1631968 RepID=UPI001E60A736|nr:DMT family transporter [Planctobacterium marinum]MCC2608104.1 DMT family transporter [Planctobacterium marinum]